jgi:protein Mpv17
MPTWVPREYLLDLDWKRTVRFGLSGALLNGPCGFKWMMLMEKIFGTHKSVRVIIGKIAADALIYSPFIIAMFFSFQGVLERKTLFEIVEKIENKFKHAILLSWSIWPLANLVGLLAIPFKYRMLFNNILSVGWNTYMSQYNCSTIEQMDLNSEQLHESSELGQKIKGESIQCYCLRCRSTVF